jgi:glucan phosphoethanolaminetransferase (alkaline phosphatase superfamily)
MLSLPHGAIDPSMLVNVLQTDRHEAADLFSWRMLLTWALGGLPALAVVWRQPVRRGAGRAAGATCWPRVAGLALVLAGGGAGQLSSRCRRPCATTSSCAT